LHAVWDHCLPTLVAKAPCSAGGLEFSLLAATIRAQVTPAAITGAVMPGDHHSWAAAWATDALHQAVASQAYEVTLTSGRRKTAHHGTEGYCAGADHPTPAKAGYTPSRVGWRPEHWSRRPCGWRIC
jgi:hypothetical protein